MSDSQSLAALRRFHLEGRDGESAPELPRSAWLHPSVRFPDGDGPVLLRRQPDGSTRCETLDDALEAMLEGETSRSPLAPHRRELRRRVEAQSGGEEPVRDVLRRVGEPLLEELAPAESEHAALSEALETTIAAFDEGDLLAPSGPDLPLRLLAHAVRERRHTAADAWSRHLRALCAELQARLAADRRRRGDLDGEELSQGLGALGSRFLDPGRLAQSLGGAAGTVLADGRRGRLEELLTRLETAVDRGPGETPLLLVDAELGERGVAVAERPRTEEGWQVSVEAEPLQAALERFDRLAGEVARDVAAARVARLELDDRFDPSVHEAALAAFDWQAFHRDELRFLPTVVALVSLDRIAASGMAPLSRLLRSGRPVQVVVLLDPERDVAIGEGTELRFEPVWFGLSHRGAFVHQGSGAAPGMLYRGLARGLASATAALHVVTGPATRETALPRAALWSRALPTLVFDPEAQIAGGTGLELDGNPQPDREWPRKAIERDDASAVELAFTPADHACLLGDAGQLMPIDESVADADLTPVADWLALDPTEGIHHVPFVWGLDDDERPIRLAVSRRLALACRDVQDSWRRLRLLAGGLAAAPLTAPPVAVAGSNGEERAVTGAELDLETERQRLAGEVVGRLVRALLGSPVGQPPAGTEGS